MQTAERLLPAKNSRVDTPADGSEPSSLIEFTSVEVTMQRLRLAVLVVVVAWSAIVLGQAPAPSVTLFEGARVLVGDGRAPIENASFIVNGARFQQIGGASNVRVPAGSSRINLAGK